MSEFRSDERGTVLLVEEETAGRLLLERSFSGSGLHFEIVGAASASDALAILAARRADVVIAARHLSDAPEEGFLPILRELHPDLPVFLIAGARDSMQGQAGIDLVDLFEVMRSGAADYLTYSPLDLSKLPHLALRAIEDARTRVHLRELTALHASEAVRSAEQRRAAEARGKELAAIAHDLRSPLAGLMALLELIDSGNDRSLSAPVRDRLARLRGAAEQIVALADEITDLALVETGKLSLAARAVDLEETMLAARRQLEPKLRSRTATLKITVPAGIAPLHGDPLRIRRILTSLVSGLLKLAEGTALELVAASQGAMVEITLREAPLRGIPVEAMPPGFAEGEASWSEPRPGGDDLVGLGLSVARGLVRLHGGTLRLPGDVERGTLAVLTLPAAPTEPKHWAEKSPEPLRPQT